MRVEIRGVEELSFRERQVVVLKESGLSVAEIAERLGIAEASVNTLLHRARRKGYEVVIVLPGSILGLTQDKGENEEDESHEGGPAKP